MRRKGNWLRHRISRPARGLSHQARDNPDNLPKDALFGFCYIPGVIRLFEALSWGARCAVLLSIGYGCSSTETRRCASLDDCDSGRVCVDGFCRSPCNSDDECGIREACTGGVCIEGPRGGDTGGGGDTVSGGDTGSSGDTLNATSIEVSTINDNNNIGTEAATVPNAGGENDVSLREAILIANESVGPVRIVFRSAVFPMSSPTVIQVGADLPTITKPELTIDGTGSNVVVRGAGEPTNTDPCTSGCVGCGCTGTCAQPTCDGLCTAPSGFVIEASDVTIDGIAIEEFEGCFVTGLAVVSGDRFTLINSSLRRNSFRIDTLGASVRIDSGNGHVIENVTFEQNLRDAIRINEPASGVRVTGCTFGQAGDDTIQVRGDNCIIEFSEFTDTAGNDSHVEVSGDNLSVTDNNFIEGYSAVHFADPVTRATITGNAFRVSRSDHVFVEFGAGVSVSGGSFDPASSMLVLAAGQNEDATAPVITAFDSTNVSGTAPSSDGVVDIYARGGPSEDFVHQGSVNLTGTSWAFALSGTQSQVLATFTTSGGSTSPTSTPVMDPFP